MALQGDRVITRIESTRRGRDVGHADKLQVIRRMEIFVLSVHVGLLNCLDEPPGLPQVESFCASARYCDPKDLMRGTPASARDCSQSFSFRPKDAGRTS